VNAVAAEKMGAEDVPMTAEGSDQLRSELEELRTDGRRQMSERLREARETGHRDRNQALYDLLVEQAQLERRIASLEKQVAAHEIHRVAPPRHPCRR
jgi:transcription elongation GreA/GreB family factor